MNFARRTLVLLALAPFALPATVQASNEAEWLGACEAGGTARLECLTSHLQTLQDDQENDLDVLHTVLDTIGPDGTDYAAARELLDSVQADWEGFVQADCRMLDLVMGDFGNMAGEPIYCLIEHYEARNAQIERWIARIE